MNADFNARGGLTIDRDSLHASPEYARQIAAAKQLRERDMNADVEKAVEALSNYTQADADGVMVLASRQAIEVTLQALRDQEAEIARLHEDRDSQQRCTIDAMMRAETAKGLLRDIRAWDLDGVFSGDAERLFMLPYELRRRITAHLGGEND